MDGTWVRNGGMNTEALRISSYKQPIPRKSLTLVERIAVINEYDKSPNTRHLARVFGCGRTQIQNILRHRHEYMKEWENNGDPYRKRRRQSMVLLSLGAIVCEWVQRSRARGIVVTDDLIRQTGVQVARILTFPGFHPSRRWLERLKQKYKLFDLDQPIYLPACEGSDVTNKSLDLEDIMIDLNNTEKGQNFVTMNKPLNYYMFEANITQQQGNSGQGLSTIGSDQNCIYVPSGSSSSELSDNDSSEVYSFQNEVADLQGMEPQPSPGPAVIKAISSYREALNHLVPLEQFALLEEDIRAIGLINQLENLFTEKLLKLENK